MKKVLLSLTVVATIFATSCKKSSNSTSSVNGYTFNGTTSTASSVTVDSIGEVSAISSDLSSVFIAFGTNSTAAGSYNIVTSSTAANQVDIAYTKSSKIYSSKTNGATATVGSSNGKVTVVTSDFWVYNTTNPSDSMKLALNLTQTN